MAIDSLNSLSTEQLLAMQMQTNGQLTSSNNSSTINESDIAFQSVLQDYSKTLGSNTNSDNGISTEQLLAMSLMTNGQLTSSDSDSESSRSMSDQMNFTNLLIMQQLQKEAKEKQESKAVNTANAVKQECATGQNLRELPLIINGQQAGYADFSKPSNVPAADMAKITQAVEQASKKYGVDKNLIMAIIKQESNFNSNAVSGAGAMGLMQVMPANFSSVGITDPYDVTQNVNGGTQIIKRALDQYNGDVSMALMAYNGGSGNMQRRGVLSSNDLYKMPKETQNYVPSVLRYYRNGIK